MKCEACGYEDSRCECIACGHIQNAPSSCTVDSIVGFPIPTSYEEYLLLTDDQKFRLYEITKKPNVGGET